MSTAVIVRLSTLQFVTASGLPEQEKILQNNAFFIIIIFCKYLLMLDSLRWIRLQLRAIIMVTIMIIIIMVIIMIMIINNINR